MADRKRLNKTTAIGLDETSFVKLSTRNHTDYATTVADVENHQIIEMAVSTGVRNELGKLLRWFHKSEGRTRAVIQGAGEASQIPFTVH